MRFYNREGYKWLDADPIAKCAKLFEADGEFSPGDVLEFDGKRWAVVMNSVDYCTVTEIHMREVEGDALASCETERDRLRAELDAAHDGEDALRSEVARLRAQIAPLQSVTQGVEVPDLPSAVWADAKTEDSRDQCISVVRDWYRDWIASRLVPTPPQPIQPEERRAGPEECEWHPGDIPGTGVRGWKTACGEAMYPKHRWRLGVDGLNFCPNCGKRCVEVSDDESAARDALRTSSQAHNGEGAK